MKLDYQRLTWCMTLALCVQGAWAAEPQAVEATGEAAIVEKNRPLAKDRAIEDALRNAVSQACGTLVSSETEVKNSQLVSDKILAQAKGYVTQYDVVSEKEERGVVKVAIRAKVSSEHLEKDLAAIGVTLRRKGMPRLAVLIAEQRIDQVKPAAWWGQQGAGKGAAAGALRLDQRLVENALIEQWTQSGFTFIDLESLSGKVQSAGIVSADLSADQVRQLGNLTDADVVIVGTAISTHKAAVADLVGDKSVQQVACAATVNARVFNADNGEILTAGDASKDTFNLDALSCGRDALLAAAKELAPALQAKLLAKWNAQLGSASRVKMTVTGLDSLSTLNELKALLSGRVRGVQGVDQKSYKAGRAELDVRLAGAADAFATELDGKPVKKLKLKVNGVTANTVDVELVK